jgi:cell division septum initiation protein DivIVA
MVDELVLLGGGAAALMLFGKKKPSSEEAKEIIEQAPEEVVEDVAEEVVQEAAPAKIDQCVKITKPRINVPKPPEILAHEKQVAAEAARHRAKMKELAMRFPVIPEPGAIHQRMVRPPAYYEAIKAENATHLARLEHIRKSMPNLQEATNLWLEERRAAQLKADSERMGWKLHPVKLNIFDLIGDLYGGITHMGPRLYEQKLERMAPVEVWYACPPGVLPPPQAAQVDQLVSAGQCVNAQRLPTPVKDRLVELGWKTHSVAMTVPQAVPRTTGTGFIKPIIGGVIRPTWPVAPTPIKLPTLTYICPPGKAPGTYQQIREREQKRAAELLAEAKRKAEELLKKKQQDAIDPGMGPYFPFADIGGQLTSDV